MGDRFGYKMCRLIVGALSEVRVQPIGEAERLVLALDPVGHRLVSLRPYSAGFFLCAEQVKCKTLYL